VVNGIRVIKSFSLNIAITKEKIPKKVIVKNSLGKIFRKKGPACSSDNILKIVGATRAD
jgi:hypothetical protein